MSRLDCVVFDLDGTLIDTVPLIVASHQHALRTVLGREESEVVLRAGIGRPLLEQMHGFDADRAEELFHAYRAWNHANTAALLGRFPDVDDVVRTLARDGFALGVATSKMRDAVDLAFAIEPPAVAFGVVVTIEDTVRHKPHPDPVLHAIERLGSVPARSAYVGDAASDLRAARAAGCASIGVTWGAATRAELELEAPDAIAETAAELLAILRGGAR
jgi:pyrophosphatase PpaX